MSRKFQFSAIFVVACMWCPRQSAGMDTEKIVDAVQSTAEASSKFADLAGKVGGFVSKVIGGASNQFGGVLEDCTRFYRYKNLLAIADKVEALHRRRKIEGTTIEISPRLAIPMLESAALEDSEILQEVWARLIANATDPNFKETLHPSYLEVIKQMSPDEAMILNSLLKLKMYPMVFSSPDSEDYSHALKKLQASRTSIKKQSHEAFKLTFILYQAHCVDLKLNNQNNVRVYIDNLLRLRILELGYIFSTTEDRRRVEVQYTTGFDSEGYVDVLEPKQNEYLKVTPFGQSFIAACIADTI